MRLSDLLKRRAFDALVLVLAVLAEISVWLAPVPGPKPVLVLAMLLATVPLLGRLRFPFAAPVCVFAALAAMSFAEPEAPTRATVLLVPLYLAFWSLAAHGESRRAAAGLFAGFACMALVLGRAPAQGYGETAGEVLLGGGLWLPAFALRRRSRRAVELEVRAARLEREREERARVAVAVERARIARELHDVVAHCVSVMTVQAGAARMLLAEEPERARAPLRAVEETGRQALAEMRRLLGILREEGEPSLAPQPGLGSLEGLLAQARATGLPVELTVEGERARLPPGVDLAAYRIVQEALTNARKHAGPAHTQVSLRYHGEMLELEIADDGHGPTGSSGGGGHGLVGMRERATLYGGALEAGPRPTGGFTVSARLPIEAAPT